MEINFNGKAKAHVETEKDFKIHPGNAKKYVFVLKPKINRLWSLTAWIQILGMSLIIYVTLSNLLKCSVPPFL